ncbi:MAG: GNAT family N-acetyltransferase [Propionibacteriales bacterium]|nr:GNAT family N-acetyltransferase [Propionibacteriales bacterium]
MTLGWPARLVAGPVGLRPLTRGDATRWAELRRDNTGWLEPWESSRPPESAGRTADYRELTRDMIRQGREGRSLPFVVTYDKSMVGQLTVTGITWGSARWALMGYWIDQAHAGRGIITTAVAMACDHCFGTMGLHRVEIAIRPENTASLRVVEKLGFARIGLAPRYLHINGMWRDHELFALTSEDVPDGVLSRLRSRGSATA